MVTVQNTCYGMVARVIVWNTCYRTLTTVRGDNHFTTLKRHTYRLSQLVSGHVTRYVYHRCMCSTSASSHHTVWMPYTCKEYSLVVPMC